MRRILLVVGVVFVVLVPVLADTWDSDLVFITDPTITPTAAPPTPTATHTPLPPPATPTPTVNPAETFFESAFDAYERGDYQQAIEDYTRSLEIGGYYEAFAHNNRGLAYTNLGEYDLAIADFTAAIERDNAYYQAYQNRAWAYHWAGEHRLAIADAETALQIQPNEPFSYFIIALANEALENYQEALANYDLALQNNPDYVDVYLSRGILRDRLDDQSGAASDYYAWLLGVESDRRFETILSGSVTLDMAEGRTYVMTFPAESGQTLNISATAREENMDPLMVVLDTNGNPLVGDDDDGGGLNAAIRDYSVPADGFYSLIVGHAGGGSFGTVDVTLSLTGAMPSPTQEPLATQTLFPSPTPPATPTPTVNPAESFFDSAFDAYERGDYQQAIEDYTRSLEIGGYYEAFAHHNRGLAYYNLERYEEALADFDAAIALDSAYAHAYYMRGLTYQKLDRHELALENFNRAIELDPENSNFWLVRGIFYEEAGSSDQAAADYWQYIQRMEAERLVVDLPADNILSLELSLGRVYAVPIAGSAGESLTVRTDFVRDTDLVDPILVLLGPDGEALVGDDDSGGGLKSLISDFILPTSGAYTLVISHAGGGSYGSVTVSIQLERSADDANNNLVRGHEAFRTGDYNSALNFYDAAYQFDNALEGLYWRGRVYAATDNPQAALADYTEVIAQQPNFSEVYLSRGRVYQALGEQDLAASDYYQWLLLNSRSHSDPIVDSADLITEDTTLTVALEAGQYASSVLQLSAGQQVTIEAQSEDGDPLIVLLDNSDNLPLVGDDDSGGDLNARVESYPIMRDGGYSLLVGSAGARAGGTMTITIRLTASDKTAEGYFAQGYAIGLDDPAEAIALFDQAIARNPAYAEAYYWRGRAYRALGDTANALRNFSLAILTDNTFSLAYLSRGLYYDEIVGDTARAALDYHQWLLLTSDAPISDVLFSNQPITRDLARGTLYRLTFSGVAGDVIGISANSISGNPDPLLVILDAQGAPIAANDDGGGDLNALIADFELPANGRYTLLVGAAAAGDSGVVEIRLSK